MRDPTKGMEEFSDMFAKASKRCSSRKMNERMVLVAQLILGNDSYSSDDSSSLDEDRKKKYVNNICESDCLD